jgi:hypothetical protein
VLKLSPPFQAEQLDPMQAYEAGNTLTYIDVKYLNMRVIPKAPREGFLRSRTGSLRDIPNHYSLIHYTN